MEKVLRSVLQKESGVGDLDFQTDINYVFGSQGVYTKMFSGLNLEQDLRIGGPKQIFYENNSDSFKVIEKYYLNDNKNIYYEVETLMNKIIGRFLVNNQDEFLVENQSVEPPFLVFQEKNQEFSDNVITISLFAVRGEVKTLLKTKQVYFVQDDNSRKYMTEVIFS